MDSQMLIDLLAGCPGDSPLHAVAQAALAHLRTLRGFDVVLGKPLSVEHYLEIYRMRLEHLKERNIEVPGTEETVRVFGQSHGLLGGGYANTPDGPIYFWTDESGGLAGCVMPRAIGRCAT